MPRKPAKITAAIPKRISNGRMHYERIPHPRPSGEPFLRSVSIALEEKGAPYRIQTMAPGEIRSEAYRELQPFGRMPVIEHGGYVL